MPIEQGDIITIENMKGHFLVVSKNYFNATEQAILCPIDPSAFPDPLHIVIKTEYTYGLVMCEQMRLIDLHYRGYKKVDQIHYAEIIDITDAIQSIFDYQ